MSLATNIANAFTAVAAALKATRTLMNGNAADNSALSTTQKASLLLAINEVYSMAQAASSSGGAVINDSTASSSQTYSSSKITSVASAAAAAVVNDAAATSSTTNAYSASKVVGLIAALIADGATAAGTTWSSTKITSYVTTQVNALLNNAPAALDTLKELADAIGDDANFANTVTTALGNRIRIDAAQTYTTAQITQIQSNLSAAGIALSSDVATVSGNLSTLTTNVGDTTRNFTNDFTNALNS